MDPATLTGVAGTLGAAHDELNATFVDVVNGSSVDAEVFGDPEVAGSWGDFSSAYLVELQEDINALSELVNKLLTTAQRYEEAEASVTGAVKGASAG